MTDETASVQGEDDTHDEWEAMRRGEAPQAEPPVPAPSDEAINAAILAASNPVHDDGHTDTYYAGLLAAAYAIDLPDLLDEARAEGEAAMLDRAIAYLRDGYLIASETLAREFNPEAEKANGPP